MRMPRQRLGAVGGPRAAQLAHAHLRLCTHRGRRSGKTPVAKRSWARVAGFDCYGRLEKQARHSIYGRITSSPCISGRVIAAWSAANDLFMGCIQASVSLTSCSIVEQTFPSRASALALHFASHLLGS